MTVTRGTSNGNARGSSYDRRTRRGWLMATYRSNVSGYSRCYRCGVLLFNPDVFEGDAPELVAVPGWSFALPLTVDRIVPGCQGGTYTRTNIRPACGGCNSATGAPLAARKGKH